MAICDYGNAFNELCKRLEHCGFVEDVSEEFEVCPLEKKVAFAYDLLQSEKLLPTIFLSDVSKCPGKATEFKQQGNKCFLQKNDKEALRYYCKSICFSPNESEELYVAYANRSAVLFSLNQCRLSMIDINRALHGRVYPSALRYKLLERKGKCLLKLGDTCSAYQCLQDALEELKQSKLSDTEYKRIENNITTCMNECNSQQTANKNFDENLANKDLMVPPHLRSANASIPNAFSGLQVRYSEDQGRYIIADCDIQPGEVLVVEKPYASILLPHFYLTHCHFCFIRCLTMIPCIHCSLVMFCSEKCRLDSWDKYHKLECEILPYMLSSNFDKMDILALRILTKATDQGKMVNALQNRTAEYRYTNHTTRGFNFDGQYISDDYLTVHYLEDNIHRRSVADLFRRCCTASVLLYIIKEKSSFFDCVAPDNFLGNKILTNLEAYIGFLLLKYSCIIPSNAHEVSEIIQRDSSVNAADTKLTNEILEIGACLYPMLSLINHSCDPNVVRHSFGDTVVLTAIQPIKSYQQVFDNYGYHYAVHDRQTRQVQLCLQYHFKCDCEPCRFDWPYYQNLLEADMQYITQDKKLITELDNSLKRFKEILTEIIDSKTEDDHLKFLYEHLAILHKTIQRPCKQYSDCQEAIKQCLALKANHYAENKHHFPCEASIIN